MSNRAITKPLNFEKYVRLKPLTLQWDGIPLLTLVIMGGLFALLDYQFFQQPGISLELPRLPLTAIEVASPLVVITLKSNDALVMEGKLYTFATLLAGLSKAYQSATEAALAGVLIKADKGTNVQKLLDVCEVARKAGFQKVHIAASFLEEPSMGGVSCL